MLKRGKDNKIFLYPVLILLGLAFFLSMIDEEITGHQIATIQRAKIIPPCDSPLLINTESELENALQQGEKCIQIELSFVITTNHDIKKDKTAVSCKPDVILSYAPGPFGKYSAFTIKEGTKDVLIKSCEFDGAFSETIKNEGVNTKIENNKFNNNKISIMETATARGALYYKNKILYAYDKGIVLHGENAQVKNSVINNGNVGIFTGEPMNYPAANPEAICSTESYYPISCSLPKWGQNAQILDSDISNNVDGVVLYSIDNNITGNTITNNQNGILVNAIFTGGEINYYGWFEEYYQSGVKIKDNTIDNNNIAGIILTGRSDSALWGYEWTTINFFRYEEILDNSISYGGYGIILDSKSDTYYDQWNSVTWIQGNDISYNNYHGVWAKHGGFVTSFLYNTINNNGKYGMFYGDSASTVYYGSFEYLYGNEIKSNGYDGVKIENGGGYVAAENEIDSNYGKGVFADGMGDGYGYITYLVCNDISFNQGDGVYAQTDDGPDNIDNVWSNRITQNGKDGFYYFYDESWPWTPSSSQDAWWQHSELFINELSNNAGVGVNFKGKYGTAIAANNIYNNQNGNVIDTGINGYNNMWDEEEYRNLFNKNECSCGTSCTSNYDCSLYPYSYSTCESNICQCGEYPPSMTCQANNCDCYVKAWWYLSSPQPYTPYGNYIPSYGAAPYLINTNSPPLFGAGTGDACQSDKDCVFGSCYNGVCADVDSIGSTLPFIGFWTPSDPGGAKCFGPPQHPGNKKPDGYCGDGYLDTSSEQCETDSDCPQNYFCSGCACLKEPATPGEGEIGKHSIYYEGIFDDQNSQNMLENHPKYKNGFSPRQIIERQEYLEMMKDAIKKKLEQNKQVSSRMQIVG